MSYLLVSAIRPASTQPDYEGQRRPSVDLDDYEGNLDAYKDDDDEEVFQPAVTTGQSGRGIINTMTEEDRLVAREKLRNVKLPEAFLAVTPMHCVHVLAGVDPKPNTRAQAMRRRDSKYWVEAMDDEYDSLRSNNTWEVVLRPANRKVLDSRWVFKRKRSVNGEVVRYKARFVVRGFTQVHGLNFDETYASVVKSPSYRLFFALQAKLGWKCHQLDITTAFLNGDVEHEIYVKPPDGYPEG